MSPEKKRIDSFEKITINITQMRSSHIFEAVCEGPKTAIIVYDVFGPSGKDVPICRTKMDTESFMELMNECCVLEWDGFRGDHPPDILDGTMFSMKAVVNGGRKIYADGSENFPEGYRRFEKALFNILWESKRTE